MVYIQLVPLEPLIGSQWSVAGCQWLMANDCWLVVHWLVANDWLLVAKWLAADGQLLVSKGWWPVAAMMYCAQRDYKIASAIA